MKLSKKARRHLAGIVAIVASLAVTYVLVFGQGGYLELRRQQQELDAQILENQQLKQEMQDYLKRIESLKNDPGEMERLMRESDYARPDEVIIALPEDSSSEDQ